jgi:lysophospholipid acyltransferase (LPLAT)-like uncharacterized protein
MLTRIIALILYLLTKLFNLTYRYTYYSSQGTLSPSMDYRVPRPSLFAVWHQNIIATLFHTKTPHVLMVSSSKDGNLIAYTLRKLGHLTARGSSTRGGGSALDEMIGWVKKGISAAITVDGPLGPPHIVKGGIIRLAQETGAPIIPIICLPKNYWEFNSWDRFRLPKPFTKIAILVGNPIYIPTQINETELEAFKNQVRVILEEKERLAREVL